MKARLIKIYIRDPTAEAHTSRLRGSKIRGSQTRRLLEFAMHTVILEVNGGVIQDVYSDTKDLRVIKIEWNVGRTPGDAVDVDDSAHCKT